MNSNFLATGSFEGAVNIYNINDISGLRNGNLKPEKTLLNLTTAINALRLVFIMPLKQKHQGLV